MHLTTTVNKNVSVVRNDSNDHLVFFGPMFLHGISDYDTYCTFFDEIRKMLKGSPNLVGSDNEKALRNAIKDSLPQSTT